MFQDNQNHLTWKGQCRLMSLLLGVLKNNYRSAAVTRVREVWYNTHQADEVLAAIRKELPEQQVGCTEADLVVEFCETFM